MVEGRNAWVSIRGELWKRAPEQVRKATGEEEMALGLLKDECEELKEALRRKDSKRGLTSPIGRFPQKNRKMKRVRSHQHSAGG